MDANGPADIADTPLFSLPCGPRPLAALRRCSRSRLRQGAWSRLSSGLPQMPKQGVFRHTSRVSEICPCLGPESEIPNLGELWSCITWRVAVPGVPRLGRAFPRAVFQLRRSGVLWHERVSAEWAVGASPEPECPAHPRLPSARSPEILREMLDSR